MAYKKSNFTYKSGSKEPFRLSRSKIDLFIQCPKCFYLDRKLGLGRVSDFPLNLNNAVDLLLKKEFDKYRTVQAQHPLCLKYGIKAIPFQHSNLEIWRDALKAGISYIEPETNFNITGGIDDIWINENNDIHIVDYKSTAKEQEIDINSEWQLGYKRQVEIYQWLFRKNNFKVSNTAYFVYANGRLDKEELNSKLEFNMSIIPYEGDDGWVMEILRAIKLTLDSEVIPEKSPNCDWCLYRELNKNL